MKIADYISKNIQEYPLLYKDVDYEKSKMKVLNHIFFVIGNGLEMAETEIPEEGGYIVDPNYKRNKATGEYIRVKDKPYGKEKHKPLPEDYFDTIIYYVSSINPPIDTVIKKKRGSYTGYYRFKKSNDRFSKPFLQITSSEYSFSPYPLSKNYSIACEIFYNNLFLQPDWLEALVELCKRTLDYFNDEDQYKMHSYYVTQVKIASDKRYFEERMKREGIEGIKKLRENWGYEILETVPTDEEIEKRKTDVWNIFRAEQLEFLTAFLNKYDK